MKAGVMQPYFAPYIGYWQLIAAADTFVILDDVNYINKGWINRNEIKDGKFTIPLHKASQNKIIRDLDIVSVHEFLFRVEKCYKGAKYFLKVMELIDRRPLTNISQYIHSMILAICDYLEISTKIIPTSSVFKEGKGQDRIINICKELGATVYINPEGGKHLYTPEIFAANGVDLCFLHCMVDNKLSIIDLLMTHSPDQIKNLLTQYHLEWRASSNTMRTV